MTRKKAKAGSTEITLSQQYKIIRGIEYGDQRHEAGAVTGLDTWPAAAIERWLETGTIVKIDDTEDEDGPTRETHQDLD